MLSYSYVLCLIIVAGITATVGTTIPVSECTILDVPHATYQLVQDIVVSDNGSNGFVCLYITSPGITLDGNGFELSSTSLLDAAGVQYYGANVTITNMRISNLMRGILAKGKFGKIENNIIQASTGIDVSVTHTTIIANTIRGVLGADTASGIEVSFPSAAEPTEAFLSITNNVISDIHGAYFAMGISVFSATSVKVMHNRIYNLHGAVTQELSTIDAEVEIKGNIHSPPAKEDAHFRVKKTEGMPISSAILLSCAAILVSALYFLPSSSAPSSQLPTPSPTILSLPPMLPPTLASTTSSMSSLPLLPNMKEEMEDEEDDREFEELMKKKEAERMEKDGADEVSVLSFAAGSSPPLPM